MFVVLFQGYANISFDLEVKKSVFFFYDVKLNGKDVPTPTYLFDHSSVSTTHILYTSI